MTSYTSCDVTKPDGTVAKWNLPLSKSGTLTLKQLQDAFKLTKGKYVLQMRMCFASKVGD